MISTFFFAWLSDRTKKRAVWLAAQNFICITGLMVTGYTNGNATRYFGLFLVGMGASGCVPGVLAYQANNVTSHSKLNMAWLWRRWCLCLRGLGIVFCAVSESIRKNRPWLDFIP